MRKMFGLLLVCLILGGTVWFASVISDRQMLNENVIRLHVVAHSDSPEDQRIKLLIRDEVNRQLEPAMAGLSDAAEAKRHLQSMLPQLEQIANEVLAAEGCTRRARVTLQKEAFSTRHYDTFSLPAGVYDALRITVGEGQGQNWWCVVFPRLCMPQTEEEFADTAVGSGFQQPLTGALRQEEGYEVRFFLLDLLGWVEKFLFGE